VNLMFQNPWRQSKHPNIHHKMPAPSTRSNISDAHVTNYSQDGNVDISKAAIMSLSLQTMTVFHFDC
jgi:hypothetical protein